MLHVVCIVIGCSSAVYHSHFGSGVYYKNGQIFDIRSDLTELHLRYLKYTTEKKLWAGENILWQELRGMEHISDKFLEYIYGVIMSVDFRKFLFASYIDKYLSIKVVKIVCVGGKCICVSAPIMALFLNQFSLFLVYLCAYIFLILC